MPHYPVPEKVVDLDARNRADQVLPRTVPGYSLHQLVASASNDGFPPDISERADEYLYQRNYR